MNAQQEIKDEQQEWAKSKGIYLDKKGYVRTVKENLRVSLSPHARAGYEGGDGSELRDTARKPANMKALHSSSALVANLFDYWTDRKDKSPLLQALDIDQGSVKPLDFEKKFPTKLGGNPPNLDVAIKSDSDHVVAIESKFMEHLSRSTVGKDKFKPSYFPTSGGLWTQEGLLACQELAEEIHRIPRRFEFLNPWQLLKHALGLATQLGDKFSLYYLYYDWPEERSQVHKNEIARFADRVGDELRFKALTYQRVYERLKESPEAERDYLDYLGGRYFSGKGAG